MSKPFAIVTGASSGIGFELAAICAQEGASETDFFERADMLDTKVGQSEKDDPADVARVGFDTMMRSDGDVVSGWQNRVRSAIANVTPAGVLAEHHARTARPGSGKKPSA